MKIHLRIRRNTQTLCGRSNAELSTDSVQRATCKSCLKSRQLEPAVTTGDIYDKRAHKGKKSS